MPKRRVATAETMVYRMALAKSDGLTLAGTTRNGIAGWRSPRPTL